MAHRYPTKALDDEGEDDTGIVPNTLRKRVSGYPLTTTRGVRYVIQTYVTDTLRKELLEYCERNELSLSSALRIMVIRGLRGSQVQECATCAFILSYLKRRQ